MRENAYQAQLIKRLRRMFPDGEVVKNDPNYLPGILDLTIFNGDRWGMLEVKASESSPIQPNQPYYVEKFNRMSFAAFIYPENEEEVLRALQHALEPRGNSRLSRR